MGEIVINVALFFFQWTTAPDFPVLRKAVIVGRVTSNWKRNSTTSSTQAQALKNQVMWFFPAASQRTLTAQTSSQWPFTKQLLAGTSGNNTVCFISLSDKETDKWHLWSRTLRQTLWQMTNLWHLIFWKVLFLLNWSLEAQGLRTFIQGHTISNQENGNSSSKVELKIQSAPPPKLDFRPSSCRDFCPKVENKFHLRDNNPC